VKDVKKKGRIFDEKYLKALLLTESQIQHVLSSQRARNPPKQKRKKATNIKKHHKEREERNKEKYLPVESSKNQQIITKRKNKEAERRNKRKYKETGLCGPYWTRGPKRQKRETELPVKLREDYFLNK
jgi:hypothetical protein